MSHLIDYIASCDPEWTPDSNFKLHFNMWLAARVGLHMSYITKTLKDLVKSSQIQFNLWSENYTKWIICLAYSQKIFEKRFGNGYNSSCESADCKVSRSNSQSGGKRHRTLEHINWALFSAIVHCSLQRVMDFIFIRSRLN